MKYGYIYDMQNTQHMESLHKLQLSIDKINNTIRYNNFGYHTKRKSVVNYIKMDDKMCVYIDIPDDDKELHANISFYIQTYKRLLEKCGLEFVAFNPIKNL